MTVLLPPDWGRFVLFVVVAGSATGVAGCSAGGGGGSGMTIQTCSLACSDSAGPGTQVSCGVTNVTMNQEIRVTFSSEVDEISATSNSFQLTEIGGRTPAGTLSLDPNDAKTLVYRPQLIFDSTGNPIFGLSDGKSYALLVPAHGADLGPFIRNRVGTPNTTQLSCTLVAGGLSDPKPGRPRVSVTIDRVTGYDANGEPNSFDFDSPAQGATNVFRGTSLQMAFDDVMNPGTLANPVTNVSSFIRVFVDANGDLSDANDRVQIAGTYSVTIDQANLRSSVIFTPSRSLPSAGAGPDLRKIVLDLSPQIADIGGLPLLNAGVVAFTPEQIALEQLVFSEEFNGTTIEDPQRTGSPWGNGFAAPGIGGGSGRLGDLVVAPGAIVELSTDSEDFSAFGSEVFNPTNVIDRPANLEITNGVFEFARLRVETGGVLRFKGSRPARVLVRGEAAIQGLIDLSGTGGLLQNSAALVGGPGGLPGPNGGAGGAGGSRPDGTAFTGTFNGIPIGGVPNLVAGPSNVLDPATYLQVNGKDGNGVPFPSTIDPSPTLLGGGSGGLGWPQPTAANPNLHMPATVLDVSGLQPDRLQFCQYIVPAASGGGGSHAIPGAVGEAIIAGNPNTPTTLAPEAPGGGDLLVDDPVRSLSPELGYLRGGGGGGGGGAHLQLTQVFGTPGNSGDCALPLSPPGPVSITSHVAHSSAGGGGGGGGLQLAAGRRIVQSGIIDASGGDGGSGTFPPEPQAATNLAQGGGGGAGGSILLQSQLVTVSAVPNRLRVSGGLGGDGSGRPFFPVRPARGGNGSPGLLRWESAVAPVIDTEQLKISPSADELFELFGNAVSIDEVFTGAQWAPPPVAPEGWSGAQSCWVRPNGPFFRLVFEADGGELGWDMRLRIAGQAALQSFRGQNDLFPAPLEQVFGSDFGTSPVVVRFQGARAAGNLVDPCAVPDTGAASPISGGSLTDWVRHPSELTDFHGADVLTPNMFRFVILWDRSQPELAQVEGVEDLTVTIQPD